MPLSRREFFRLTSVIALGTGATATVATGCGDSAHEEPGAPDELPSLFTVGLYSWDEIARLPERVRGLGLTHFRIGGQLTDRLMRYCAQNGFDVLLNVTPETGRDAVEKDATFVELYLRQLDRILERYGPNGAFWGSANSLPYTPIRQVEICNEPNFGYGFVGDTDEIVALYAQVLMASYDHVKQRWPEVTVVGFAAGGASDAAPGFLEKSLAVLAAAGRTDCYDVVAVHLYADGTAPEWPIVESWGSWVAAESIQRVQEVMLANGIDKPLWITEAGYQISQADGGRFPPHVTRRRGGVVTPEMQAAYTVRLNMTAARAGVSRMYHMFVVDTDGYNGGWLGNDPSHRPRPVATAMRQLSDRMKGTNEFEAILDGAGGTQADSFAYRFRSARGSTVVAWSLADTELRLPLDSGRDTTVTDVYGTTIETVNGDSYLARLSASPIFLTSGT